MFLIGKIINVRLPFSAASLFIVMFKRLISAKGIIAYLLQEGKETGTGFLFMV